MSELGDKGDRYVEDKQKVDYHEELLILHRHLEEAVSAEGDKWKTAILEANASMLRMWHMEGVPEMKQTVREQAKRLEQRSNELRKLRKDLECKDVLLAEAAEVLRTAKGILFTRYSDQDKAMDVAADWWDDHAKPFLEKVNQ